MNITLLLGSIRQGRRSDRPAHYLMERLSEIPEVQPVLLDLAQYPLPQLENRWAQQASPDPNLVFFSRALTDADALIFISPEYHGSYTGVLKNAIDHFWKEFKRKPIGVVAVGAGRMGGINASVEMQHLILSLGAYPCPVKMLVPFAKEAFDEQNQPAMPGIKEGADSFLNEFLWFSQALYAAHVGEKSHL
ncbi:MAG: NADPH-dependent oxidoreductase [Bacteroidetes bacterium]|nr:MAG: NADPH-dependent oxidoreductase [Bacteroidota bacterium]